MKKAVEIIKTLYDNGTITFEEAIELGINVNGGSLNNEDLNLKYMNPVADKYPNNAEELIDLYLKQVCENFEISECVDFMNRINWHWNNVEEINERSFKEKMRSEIAYIVDKMLSYAKNETIDNICKDDKSFRSTSAGFEVVGWFNENANPEIEVNFIASTGYAGDDVSIDDFIRIANLK